MATQVMVERKRKCDTQLHFHIKKYLIPRLDKRGKPILDKKGNPEKRMMIVRTLFLHFPHELGNSTGFWKVVLTKRRPKVLGWYDEKGKEVYQDDPRAEYFRENKKPEWVPGPEVISYSVSCIPTLIEKQERGNRFNEPGTPQTRKSTISSYKYRAPVRGEDGETLFTEHSETVNGWKLDSDDKVVLTTETVTKLKPVTEVVEDACWFSGEKPTWGELHEWLATKEAGDTGGFKKVHPYERSLSYEQFLAFLSPRVGGDTQAENVAELLEKLPPQKNGE